MNKINIRGIAYDNVDPSGAVALAIRKMEASGAAVVVTPNAEIAQMCIESPVLMETINGADLILPDGAGVVLASKILHTPLREKVAGVDFGWNLAAYAAEHRLGLFLLGGKPGVADTAAEKLKTEFPALRICGTNDGYFQKEGKENDAVLQKINASGADILYVCFGAPLQETWIMQNKEALSGIHLAACLGGSLDIYAGTVKRAPKFLIKAHMEWLYRLLKEPKRLGRMDTKKWHRFLKPLPATRKPMPSNGTNTSMVDKWLTPKKT